MSRKLIVSAGLVFILSLAGLPTIVAVLDRVGLIACAQWARAEYVTGTAITVIAVLLFVLPGRSRLPQQEHLGTRQCPVCDSPLLRPGRYCPTCGSRI